MKTKLRAIELILRLVDQLPGILDKLSEDDETDDE
jgi:uncharacterized protein YidB (DUF937 family)